MSTHAENSWAYSAITIALYSALAMVNVGLQPPYGHSTVHTYLGLYTRHGCICHESRDWPPNEMSDPIMRPKTVSISGADCLCKRKLQRIYFFGH